jgi:hypothetical protein
LKPHKGMAALAVGAALVGTVLAPGVANASSGGGCDSSGVVSGMDIEACVSASGGTLEPDGYIIRNSNCRSVTFYLWAGGGSSVVDQWSVSCATGHKGPHPEPSPGLNHQTYYVRMTMFNSSGAAVNIDSPDEYFSY